MTSREKRKRELRMNQVRGGNYDAGDWGESLVREYEKRRKIKSLVIAGVIIAVLLAGTAVFLMNRYRRYTSYTLKWEKELPSGSFAGYEHFGENVLKYSHDGASYLDKSGNEKWIDSYEMDSPRAYVSGEYACVYDAGGTQIRIYDISGAAGAAETLRPVTKAVVSESGNCAAILEDDEASYITFYKKDGTEQDITIKTRLLGEGYPMDLALSPEGTQLITAFAYMDGISIKSKVVFYDFSEIGKNVPNRLVGGFEEPFEDSLAVRVRFLNSTYSYAVSDTGICFFSSKNLSSPELVGQAATGERIENIINYNDQVAAVYSDLKSDKELAAEPEEDESADSSEGIVGEESKGAAGAENAGAAGSKKDSGEEETEAAAPTDQYDYRLVVYKGDGTQTLNKKFSCDYDHANTDGTYFYFKGTDTLNIFNQYGTVKYSGSMDDAAHMITKAQGAGCFIFSGSDYMREYQFK